MAGLVLFGDFTCVRELWKDSTQNKNGKSLQEFMNAFQTLSITGPSNPTFSYGSSMIDLAIDLAINLANYQAHNSSDSYNSRPNC